MAQQVADEYKYYLRSVDSAAALAEARKLLHLAVEGYGDLDCPKKISVFPGTPKVSQVAMLLLHKLTPAAVGKPAPDIRAATFWETN